MAGWFFRGWQVLSSGVTLFVGASLFAWAMASLSAGNGYILEVGKPENPSLRVPLGGKITYGLKWKYLEGGCDPYVVATFTRMGKESTTLIQRRRARPRSIGEPGFENVSRDMPAGITPGRWSYRTVIEADCPTRKVQPQLFAEFEIEVFDPNTPVIVLANGPSNLTRVVKYKGKLSYRAQFDRRRPCPGDVLVIYNKHDPRDPDLVIERRPVDSVEVKTYAPQDISRQLPDTVTPGKWRFRALIESLCGGVPRTDPLVDFEFEVEE